MERDIDVKGERDEEGSRLLSGSLELAFDEFAVAVDVRSSVRVR